MRFKCIIKLNVAIKIYTTVQWTLETFKAQPNSK